jgi:DNA-binding MarR family transcriptional regulator
MQHADATHQATATELRRCLIRLGRRLRVERSAGALSSNKASVLGYLFRVGPVSPGEIAALEHVQPQTLTRVFADLEAEGLIVRTRNDRDGRRSLLALTDAGRDALTRDLAQLDGWLAAAMTGLTDTEVRLLGLVAPLLDRLADAAPIAPAVPVG